MRYFKIDYSGPGDVLTSGDQGTDDYPNYWNNASLFLSHDGADQTSVNVSQHTIVKGRVTNTSEVVQEATYVQAWVFRPFVGLTTPGSAITAIHEGSAPDALPDGSLVSFSGSAFALTKGNDDSHLIPASTSSGAWVPSDDELTAYGSHLCLVANVYSNTEGKALGTEDYFATSSYTDSNGNTQPRDGHHGQRNIALLPSAQPQQVMPFQVHPPLVQGQPTLLDIHALTSVGLGAGERWLLQSRSNVTKINSRQFVIPGLRGKPATPLSYSRKGLQGTLGLERFGEIDLAEASKATKTALKRSGGSGEVPFSTRLDGARIRLESMTEARTATITLQRDDDKGSLQAFDIVQRTEDGQILGGIRILSLVTGAPR